MAIDIMPMLNKVAFILGFHNLIESACMYFRGKRGRTKGEKHRMTRQDGAYLNLLDEQGRYGEGGLNECGASRSKWKMEWRRVQFNGSGMRDCEAGGRGKKRREEANEMETIYGISPSGRECLIGCSPSKAGRHSKNAGWASEIRRTVVGRQVVGSSGLDLICPRVQAGEGGGKEPRVKGAGVMKLPMLK